MVPKVPARRLLTLGVVLAAVPLLTAIAAAQDPTVAYVRVLLPAGGENATVLFGNHKTAQLGIDRLYVSPPLELGKKYSYEVTAVWMAGGKEVKQTRKVAVTAGSTAVVDFNMPEESKKDDTKKDEPKKDEPKKGEAKSRTFEFTYASAVTNVPMGKTVKVWLPLPQATPDQDITIVKETIPGKSSVGTEPQYGNKILFFEATPDKDGNVPFAVTFKVTRHEVKTGDTHFRKVGDTEKVERYLQADKLVPVGGKPLELIKGEKLGTTQLETGKRFYDIVNRHMKYSKEGKGWGNGDAEWACDSQFGNCSDFHSLFISLARSQKIPAKFEMGFPIPTKRGEGTIGGYHCWAWFLPDGKGWVPVDISEANRNPELRDYYFGNLTEDRVVFTTGRDIDLVPRQSGPALNFFIYPYAEVDGQAVPVEQIQRIFS